MKSSVPKFYPVYRTIYTSHNVDLGMYMTRDIYRIITIRYLYLTLYKRQRVYRSLIFTLTNKAIDSRRRIGVSLGGDSTLPCGLIFVIGPSKTCPQPAVEVWNETREESARAPVEDMQLLQVFLVATRHGPHPRSQRRERVYYSI